MLRLCSMFLVLLTAVSFFVGEAVHSAEESASAGKSYPIVAGFERFHLFGEKANSGQVLLNELNCTSCHQAPDLPKNQLQKKQAPILDGIGSRVNVEYLRRFLADPHAVKPGTTMPSLFAGLSAVERKSRVESLVHFLASTGSFHHTPPDGGAANRGSTAFQSVGCIACHGSRKPDAKNPIDVIPLGDPSKKYSINSLAGFLKDPLKTRPSGRMPNLNLTDKEAKEIANYFLKDIKVPSNLTYKYYEGNWATVPDFSKIKPKSTGGTAGFDLRVARRKNNFGLRFEGFLQIPKSGEYTFHLGSDDGSKLFIDGKQIVVNDGVHPFTMKSGKTKLTAGPHPIIVDYFQGGGEWVLRVDFQGPGVSKQSVASAVTSTKEPPRENPGFKVNPVLAMKGRQLFSSVGCAACHQLNEKGKRIPSTLAAKPLKQLTAGKGCTAAATSPNQRTPFFSLNQHQRTAIATAMASKPEPATPQSSITHTMAALNCYACHSRTKKGGPTRDLNSLFQTTIKEMGDEGRIPPPLDGVGDKLTEKWLKHVMDNGANDRPYMLTRMPKFGIKNAGHLVAAFAKVDRKLATKVPPVSKLRPSRIKAAGRFMVGEKAFACIKCHTFGKHNATGIQSIDLTKLTTRIRQDWFNRYMIKPIRFRPGTRMPTPFPGGISLLDKVLDGTPPTQLAAIWNYLEDGAKARIPQGLIRGRIPLIPKTEPVLYRNFIQGLSPRGIGVGYPGGLNLGFDADRMTLGLIWHGAFIDASKHWLGRGQGFQTPLGDHIVTLPKEVPFAVLSQVDEKWPTKTAKEQGYRFRGYSLNSKRQPTFKYTFGNITVEDFPEPVLGEIDPSLKRTITLKTDPRTAARAALLYRAAVGKTIELKKAGWYRVDGNYDVRVTQSSGLKPILRKINDQMELLIPVSFKNSQAQLIHEYLW